MKDTNEKILEMLKDEKNSVLSIASTLNIPEYEVLKLKDESEFKEVDAVYLDEILNEMSLWGELLFCKNSPEFIIEFKCCIGSIKKAKGYINFCGKSGFLGGHLNQNSVKKIGFVTTKFMGLLGNSVHFYNDKNETIFKFYLSRNEKQELLEDQVKKFDNLKAKF